jgi:hypothetical protein
MHSQNTPFKFRPFDGQPWLDDAMSGSMYRERNPLTRWSYNPWTGARREQLDTIGDPLGELIVPPGVAVFSHNVRQVKFGPPTKAQTANPAPVFYEVTIKHGEEKSTLSGTDKETLGRLCVAILRGMK